MSLAPLAALLLQLPPLPNLWRLHRAALWGAVLLVSCSGWGGLIERLAFSDRRHDLGMRMAWGFGAVLSLGGVLCLMGWANARVLLALALIGVGLACVRAAAAWGDDDRAKSLPSIGMAPLLLFVGILAALQYYGGIARAKISPDDDLAVYFVFPEKILASGTLIEPFSLRRLAAYGGQSFLHALTLVGCTDALQLPLLDMGTRRGG